MQQPAISTNPHPPPTLRRPQGGPEPEELPAKPQPDRPTLIAISALAYVLSVALHEHLGHGAACVLLGSHPVELGAFYVNCDDARLGATSVRLVALAGPLVSLATGLICFATLARVPRGAPAGYYFTWLLGSLGLMMGTGYMLFSGVTGIGDLGDAPDAALHGVEPVWAWRAALIVAGFFAYRGCMFYAVRVIDPHVAGAGAERIRGARRVALTSYFTGAIVYLVIGLFNPYGIVIVVSSALASSMGGTSGLLWMMRRLDPHRNVPGPGLSFGRSPAWIAAAVVVTLAYGLVFGRTLRP